MSTDSSARFAPIAIVARACVLPGAMSPEQLWDAVLDQRDLLSTADKVRWRLPSELTLNAPGAADPDRAAHDRVGAVAGFESIWNPNGFKVPADKLATLDPLVHWLLHVGRDCLAATSGDRQRTGAVIGNLGFPSEAMARSAEQFWRGETVTDPRNRFMSGGTAEVFSQALGLGLGASCLDAACASSLYALRLACAALQDGRADLMLAGAVQRADDLFLHVGFSALTALSRTGQSRPFHRDADGLVPAEGAVLFALKRLADARRDGDTIHGVIRGIGLSNDGRGRGLLVPEKGGQERSLRIAWTQAGIDPRQLGLLECHATGTTVGDATEIASSATVFAEHSGLPIGSLKSNLGHLITAAGGAGLLKVLAAMRHGIRPPTRLAGAENPALADTPFRVLTAAEPWPANGPRIAAVSAFGFGGNNAHLIVSEDDPSLDLTIPQAQTALPLALVGLGLRYGALTGRADVEAQLRTGLAPATTSIDAITIDLDGLRTPPRDLARCLPQQLVLFETTAEALRHVTITDPQRCSVVVGMEPDTDVARYGLRWRLASELQGDALSTARDGVVPALDAAAVLGAMPNIPANRLSSQYDFGGPSFTVQALQQSGLVALDLAIGQLQRGEMDVCLVSAVDFGASPAAQHFAPTQQADAAITMVLKPWVDAVAAGESILARLDALPSSSANTSTEQQSTWAEPGAAADLLDLALALLRHNRDLDQQGSPILLPAPPFELNLPLGRSIRCTPAPWSNRRITARLPQLFVYAGANRAEVLDALAARRTGHAGIARLTLLARPDDIDAQHERARVLLEQGQWHAPNVFYRDQPVRGETAFVFAGAGASYAGMGLNLLADLPQLKQRLDHSAPNLLAGLGAAWQAGFGDNDPSAQLLAASALAQMHLGLSEDLLGLRADAWLGYSSGETNALFASGAWRDPDALMADMDSSGLMRTHLAGEFRTLKTLWPEHESFVTWTVLAPIDEVRTAIAAQSHVRLLIIDSAEQCLIAGDRAQCDAVVQSIGRARCLPLSYSLAVHMPEVRAVAEAWYRLHHRTTYPLRCGRLYSSASARSYEPSPEHCARAILDQATDTLDMRRVIEQAWQDGVRIFIEHGPGSSFARAIRSQLGDREALILSLDRKGLGLEGLLQTAAALIAAGIDVDVDQMLQQAHVAPAANPPKRPLRLAGHWPKVTVPSRIDPSVQRMNPAPVLPSVGFRPHQPRRGNPPTQATMPASLARPGHGTPSLARPLAAAASVAQPVMSAALATQPAIAAVASQIEALGQMHQHYLRLQTDAHQRFLALRQNAMSSLLQTASTMPTVDASPAFTRTMESPKAQPRPAVVTHVVAPQKPVLEKLQPVPVATKSLTSQREPVGPTFSREQLLVHADGAISRIFGPAFAGQDSFHRQVRMPKPPLLLADRVVGLDAEPMTMGKGTIWTETDVGAEPWYLHHNHMPAGVMIEAGQADLMLISWLGIDPFNRSERVYRLLGCELTYHGNLPKQGETLRFQIELDGHAAQGDVRLMFFHYDCVNGDRPQLSVRKGQAGFFTDQELAESAGCLWTPETQDIRADARVDAPLVPSVKTSFDKSELQAFADGDLVACFGSDYGFARTHSRTPTIAGGNMLLFDRVTELSASGGPWGRGYLRAELDIDPTQWFFDGHFKNDPCMPGTLMFEACLAAMAIHLAAMGYTLKRDGWRFQPVPELPYQLQCRGQVTPTSKLLVTEVFVEERHDGPIPTLFADLLCTVDGLKAFHARRVGLQLVPDWPMSGEADIPAIELTRPVATVDGFRFDRRALLACADGRPSEAFGPMYRRFDGVQRVARLPSPPYHFISRIAEIDGPIGVMKAGARVLAEYDIPDADWYFDTNGNNTMPFAVLLEAALQPCGWLSSYVGSALTQEIELGFRNLDGDGTIFGEIRPGDGTLLTEVRLTDVSASGGMIIENFEVTCRIGDRPIYQLKTVFGFFPEAALAAQAGLPIKAEHREALSRPGERARVLDDTVIGALAPRQATGMLRMIDAIEGFWPEGGKAGLGAARANKHINTDEWFFKAHFFQDPVQPGSLGLEAMVHTMAYTMIELGLAEGFKAPRFQTIATGLPHRWKYRGQVLPKHRLVQTTLEITERGRDEQGVYAVAEASLWVDGQRIYEAIGLGLRIVEETS